MPRAMRYINDGKKFSWQKAVVLFIATIELILSLTYDGCGLWYLTATSDVNIQKLISFQFRLLVIISICISTLQVITVMIGALGIIKHQLGLTAAFCVISFGNLISYFIMMLFLLIEKQKIVDEFGKNLEILVVTPEYYILTKHSFGCMLNVLSNATQYDIYSDIELCAMDQMNLFISLNIGLSSSQFSLLILLLVTTCALHKLMVELQSEFIYNIGSRIRRHRKNEVVPLASDEWSREVVPSAPPVNNEIVTSF